MIGGTCQAFNGTVAAPSPGPQAPPENRCADRAVSFAVAPPRQLPCAVVVAVCAHHGHMLQSAGWRLSKIPKVVVVDPKEKR